MTVSDAEGRAFRRFTVEAGAGTFPSHARSDVNYEPRPAFLTPRRMGGSVLSVSAGSGGVVLLPSLSSRIPARTGIEDLTI